ncbi:MAG: DMT family transporter [Cyanobacteria bacterium P01_F01_bin.42]
MTQQLELDTPTVNAPPPPRPLVPLMIGIMILSCSAIFTRLSEQELTPLATIFNRFWIASVVLGLLSGIRAWRQPAEEKGSESLSWVEWGLLVVLAIAISARAGSWAWSLTQTSVANSNLLHNMTPVFATLGGWIFLGHSFNRKYWLGLFLATSGVVAIGLQDLNLTTEGFYGDLAALLSSVFYAVNFLIIEKLRRKLSATSIMTWSCVFVSLLLLPGVLITGDQIWPTTPSVLAAILCLGVLSQVIGQGILAYVLDRMKSGPVSLFLLLEPIITALLAWAIFGEYLSPSNWFAFIIVLLGLYLANVKSATSLEDDS